MKLRLLFFVCCFGLLTSAFAQNIHLHPKAEAGDAKSLKAEKRMPGYCQIEIINNSYDDVRVYGVFDDGSSMAPFNVYRFEQPHYISLYYYGYCHAGMNLYIDTFSGYPVYSGYTFVNSTVRIVPYLAAKQAKVEITKK